MRLLLAGGGTGGHLFPAVALAEALKAEEKDADVLFVGTKRGIEAKVLPELGWPLETVDISGFAGKGTMQKLLVIPRIVKSISQGVGILTRFRPDVVVGVGGYASAPMVLASALKGIPIVLHEQNAVPGLTNRMLGRWADRVCTSFEKTETHFGASRVELTGNPLRGGMEDCPDSDAEKPVLLVFGGSRGARAINQAMTQALEHLSVWNGRMEIVHQTGEEDRAVIAGAYDAAGWNDVTVTPFIHDMAAAYRRAHLVVCRAGATTVAELTACGRPSILVPYPYAAGDHQTANAQALAQRGAALLVDQKDLDAADLARMIDHLLQQPERMKQMANAARGLGRKGAANRILAICRDVSVRKKAA